MPGCTVYVDRLQARDGGWAVVTDHTDAGYTVKYLCNVCSFSKLSSATDRAVGRATGSGLSASDCPFVHNDAASGYYYLLRTQRYDPNGGQTSVYASRDPTNFGVGSSSGCL
jgi:hypothetical protein